VDINNKGIMNTRIETYIIRFLRGYRAIVVRVASSYLLYKTSYRPLTVFNLTILVFGST
jgi:hypothetical protein